MNHMDKSLPVAPNGRHADLEPKGPHGTQLSILRNLGVGEKANINAHPDESQGTTFFNRKYEETKK